MPRQARILTLNLGSQAISVADFRPQGVGGLVLQDYRRRDLAIENPGEPFRHAHLTAILREVLGTVRWCDFRHIHLRELRSPRASF